MTIALKQVVYNGKDLNNYNNPAEINMKRNSYLMTLVLMLVASASWAYGGGSTSSAKACAKPKFTDFAPAENNEVAAGSGFSFTASANTNPSSIKVNVKGMPADINVTSKKTGSFEVSGKLPASLKGDYARIAITAEAPNNCNGAGGWLVKIAK
ncbi:MAG: hypothetical protein ABSB19_03165 [Methylomonas sp.]